MFSKLLQTEFTTERLSNVAGSSIKTDYITNLSAQRGLLQPYGDEEVLSGQKFVQKYKLFCERIDLKMGDKVIMGEESYIVSSLKDFTYGSFPHMEAILTKH